MLLILFADAFSDNIFCHFCASMISGLVTTLASMPVDIAKTRYTTYHFSYIHWVIMYYNRIQNMRMIDGKPEYSGSLVRHIGRDIMTCDCDNRKCWLN